MPASNRGPIQIVEGQYSDECVTDLDLVRNSAVYPEIRDLLDYVNGRTMCTLITNGSVTPYGIDFAKQDMLPSLEKSGMYEGKSIGTNAYQFRIIGRIEQTSTILEQVGSSGSDGTFTLRHADRHISFGQNVLFYGSRYIATAMSQPRASGNGWLVDYKSPSGDVFSFATHVAVQPGTYTCFGGWTTFGEKSLKGYGYSKFPDMYVNHTTTQRSSISITGDAASRVLWIKYTNSTEKGGWIYEELNQQRAKFAIEDERAKIFGISNMKNSDGSMREVSNQVDPQTGLQITAGDGIENQIASGKCITGSDTDGLFTIDDIKTIQGTLKQDGNLITGYTFYWLTGTVGFSKFQDVAVDHLGNQNVTILQAIENSDMIGGKKISAGIQFAQININGDTAIVCQHPLFDDPLAFPQRDSFNRLVLSGTAMILNFGMTNGVSTPNIEMLHKAANGVNRKRVEATLNGMTGSQMGTVISQEDAMTHAILKQDMINVYDTNTCACVYPNLAA